VTRVGFRDDCPLATVGDQNGAVLTRVLVVEDDHDLRMLLRLLLEDEGYAVTEAATGDQALERFAREPSHLVLLDVRLPGLSGLEVCRALRAQTDIPVIMLTAHADSHDVVAGLEAGADDYVTKPFIEKELLARIRAQLRKSIRGREAEAILVQDIEIRPAQAQVLRDGTEVRLTRTEFNLLCYLADNPNRLLSRDALLAHVWGYDHAGDGRLVDAHIRRLRTKIEDDPGNPRLIQTVRGLGYKLAT
jgi:DNA-binding response OmpR family regulator